MYKKMFLCATMTILHSNTLCFNMNSTHFKAMLTTIKWGTGITFACALLAVIPDKDSSAKEKICLVTFSTLFSGILSALAEGATSAKPMQDEASRIEHAKNTGLMCGLALPIIAFLTYCAGKNPRNIRSILETSIKCEDIFK